jgi:hypothetical protein
MGWICCGCLSTNRTDAVACSCGSRAVLLRSERHEPLVAGERLASFRRARLERLILPAIQQLFESAPRAGQTTTDRLEVLRALVFAQAMAGYCREHGLGEADPSLLRYAVTLLPFGRVAGPGRGNLRLVRTGAKVSAAPGGWRESSAAIAAGFLELEGAPFELCAEVAALVGPAPSRTLESRLVRDAWLLQRLRKGHARAFDAAWFSFGRDADGMLIDAGSHEGARSGLLGEACQLIAATSELADTPAFKSGGQCLAIFEDLLLAGASRWPMLAAGWMSAEPHAKASTELCLQLADEEGDPKAGWRFSLRCSGSISRGLTSDAGMLRAELPPGAEHAQLSLWPPDDGAAEIWELELGPVLRAG